MHCGFPNEFVLRYSRTGKTSAVICGMSQVVLEYPRTGKTRDQCTYINVGKVECPRLSWDIPGQG